jgi:hypothetical protein
LLFARHRIAEMTWIAACNGRRGTYQETMMTDEDFRAIRIVYDLAIKFLKSPLNDEELDALFRVREMLKIKL